MEKTFNVISNNFKELPNNIEAEQSVLGSILLSNEIFDEVNTIISNNVVISKNAQVGKNCLIKSGAIVGEKGFIELSGYASTKRALDGLTKSLAVEFASKKIRINIIHPGFIKTSYYENFKKNKKKLYKWTLSRIPQKRWADPKEVAELVSFVLSDKSRYLNGENISIDGGWSNA